MEAWAQPYGFVQPIPAPFFRQEGCPPPNKNRKGPWTGLRACEDEAKRRSCWVGNKFSLGLIPSQV